MMVVITMVPPLVAAVVALVMVFPVRVLDATMELVVTHSRMTPEVPDRRRVTIPPGHRMIAMIVSGDHVADHRAGDERQRLVVVRTGGGRNRRQRQHHGAGPQQYERTRFHSSAPFDDRHEQAWWPGTEWALNAACPEAEPIEPTLPS